MFKKSAPVLLMGMMLLAVPIAGMAQGKGADKGTTTVPVGGAATVESLIQRYTPLAGSDTNATSLVNGLRTGSTVTLTGTVTVWVQATCPVPDTTETVTVPIYMINPMTKQPALGPDGKPIVVGQRTETRTVHHDPVDCSHNEVQPVTVTFTPLTGNMGLGNVDIALGFAQAQLVELGLGNPATPGQLLASLMGGEVEYGTSNPKSKKTLPGILALRASGKGWGQIAGDLGFKLQ